VTAAAFRFKSFPWELVSIEVVLGERSSIVKCARPHPDADPVVFRRLSASVPSPLMLTLCSVAIDNRVCSPFWDGSSWDGAGLDGDGVLLLEPAVYRRSVVVIGSYSGYVPSGMKSGEKVALTVSLHGDVKDGARSDPWLERRS